MLIIRDILSKIEAHMESSDILLLIGARQAGKTTILKQIQENLQSKGETTHFVNLENPEYLAILNKSPQNLFQIIALDAKRRSFVFLDEVQYLDNPSNFLKYIRDEHENKIKLIVSGSSAFYIDEKFRDSLAGRKKIFPVRTLSFRELLRLRDEPELALKSLNNLSIADRDTVRRHYHEYLIFGGYPRVALAPLPEKKEILEELAYSYIKKDIKEAHVRQEEIFYHLFKILAGSVGNLVNASELASVLGVSKTMVERYLFIMQKSFHLQLIHPFYNNVRKELRKMPKVYFYDLGLRNFFANNFDGYASRDDRGQLLENAVFRQLLEINSEEEIRFWRTTAQHEVDFIIGGERAYEVKANLVPSGTAGLHAFSKAYPDIPVEMVTFGATSGGKTKEAWEL